MRRSTTTAIAIAIGIAATALTAAPAVAATPFGPYGKAPAGSRAWAHPDGVTVVSPRADGGLSVTMYETASGGSGRLLTDLVRGGVVSRTMAGGGAVALSDPTPGDPVTTCLTGSGASYFGNSACTVKYKWHTQSGRSNPLVYYRDHTPAQWPVHSAEALWEAANPRYIDLGVTNGTCPSGTWCVEVWNAAYTGDWYGLTHFEIDSSGYFINGGVSVFLNDRLGGSATNHAISACHEMGHALGVAHSQKKASCMWADDWGQPAPFPTTNTNPDLNDFNILKLLYP